MVAFLWYFSIMMHNFYGGWNMPFGGYGFPIAGRLFMGIFLIWSLIWKGLALWKSSRKGDNVWFVILLVLNTAGVLDILYLYVFSKKSKPVKSSD